LSSAGSFPESVPKRFWTFYFTVCLLFSFYVSTAQDTSYARYIIYKLTSKEFAGRGYVNEGLRKAADFISFQFDSLHLQKFGQSYSQKFFHDVNTFPGKLELKINNKALIPGKDFIVEAISGRGKGEYKVKALTKVPKSKGDIKEFFRTDFSRKVLYVDIENADKNAKDFISMLKRDEFPGAERPAAILVKENKKLTMDIEGRAISYPVFTVLGNAVPSKITTASFEVDNKLITDYAAANIAGFIKGTSQPDSFVVITAHYDHLGMMGSETYFPGANDNASGVSLMINLAEYYSQNPPNYSVAFIGFAGEEIALLGSQYYTEHPLFPLSKIKSLINLDLLGTGEEGMMVVNATEFPEQFHLLDSINNEKKYLVKLGQRGKAKNSDHYWFTEKGVPSFFFYTMGGIQAYHDINDKAETLPLTEFADVFRLIVDFEKSLMK
jgi:aminopeptidase YwaD